MSCIHKTGGLIVVPCSIIESRRADARHAVGDCHTRKPGATPEGRLTYARHAVTDCNARKSGAIREGRLTYARHAVPDCHARKPGAIREGRIADARHTVRDCHVRKSGAIIEGIVRNYFYIISYIYCCKIRTTFEYRRIIRTSTCACGCVPIDCRKPGAIRESIFANACHAAPDCHARKTGATTEGRITDARHTVRDCNGCGKFIVYIQLLVACTIFHQIA